MRAEHEWLTRLLCLFYLLGIVVVSLTPGDLISSSDVLHMDKVGHFLAYAGLGFLLAVAFRRDNGRFLAALFVIFVGFLLEWGQSFVPGREMSILDGLANTAGLILGLLLWPNKGQIFCRWLDHAIGNQREP